MARRSSPVTTTLGIAVVLVVVTTTTRRPAGLVCRAEDEGLAPINDGDEAPAGASGPRERLSEAACLELGFTAALRCSSCVKLATLVADAALSAECEACCEEDADGGASFAAARLEVDRTRAKFWPSVQHFIEHEAAKLPACSIKYRSNQRPQLVLLDADGATQDVVSIATWSAETIVDFLRENLAAAPQGDTAEASSSSSSSDDDTAK